MTGSPDAPAQEGAGPAAVALRATLTAWRRVSLPLLLLRVFGQALEFVAFVTMARRLGSEGFGTLSVAFLVCRFLGLVADWGGVAGGSRDVAAERGVAHLRTFVWHRLFVGAALAALFAGLALSLGRPSLAPLGMTVIARGAGRDWMALGRQRGVRSGAPSLLQGGTLQGLALVVHTPGQAAWAVGAAYLAGAAASVRLNPLPSGRRHGGARVERWLVLATVADQVTSSIDTLLLAAIASTSTAGVYAAVYRIPNAWINLTGLTVAGLVPVATRTAQSSHQALRDLYRRSMRVAIAAAVALAICAPASYVAVPIIFGHAYDEGRLPLAILLVATAIGTAAAPLHAFWMAGTRDRALAGISAGGALVNVGANLAMIPRFGASGAAVATVASSIVLLALLHRGARRIVAAQPNQPATA